MINLSERKGDWVETFTGKQFYPLDPRPEEVCIEDIAHSLSMQCRFNGHCKVFYSVAEHSIIVAKDLAWIGYGAILQLQGLLHDAAEAYLSDIPRPIKHNMPEYRDVEQKLQSFIIRCFGLPELKGSPLTVIKATDDALLHYEGRKLMPNSNGWADNFKYYIPIVDVSDESLGLSPQEAEKQFLELFYKLTNELKG